MKIERAIAARGNEVDGIIGTGYNPTVAAAGLLTERHKNPNLKQFHFIGIDTDPITIQAIRDGGIDGTIAQNPFAHGYISCALLKLMAETNTPRAYAASLPTRRSSWPTPSPASSTVY